MDSQTNAENTRGRPFAKGNAGRPCGALNKTTLAAQALLDGEAEALTRKAVEMALRRRLRGNENMDAPAYFPRIYAKPRCTCKSIPGNVPGCAARGNYKKILRFLLYANVICLLPPNACRYGGLLLS
jgi:hypothetical protein